MIFTTINLAIGLYLVCGGWYGSYQLNRALTLYGHLLPPASLSMRNVVITVAYLALVLSWPAHWLYFAIKARLL